MVESLTQLAEAAIFLGLGAVVLAILSLVPVLIVFLDLDWDFWPIAVSVYLPVAGLSILGAWLARHATAGSGIGGRHDLQPGLNLIYEILFNGGGQCLTGFNCLKKCLRIWRLSRHDLDQVAAIVRWVFERGRKAMTREICAALPEVQVVRILPQLQDLPGIIWLTHDHQVIILSEALRGELAALLGRIPKATPLPEEPAPENGARDETPGPEITANDEVVQWYLALDLPPFAPLETVKQRYRTLVKIHHPDANPIRRADKAFASDERIRKINVAYHNILSKSGR